MDFQHTLGSGSLCYYSHKRFEYFEIFQIRIYDQPQVALFFIMKFSHFYYYSEYGLADIDGGINFPMIILCDNTMNDVQRIFCKFLSQY